MTRLPESNPSFQPRLPEPRSRQAHEHVKHLRDELHRIRAEKPGSGYALDAYVRYMREASLLGLNPTALPQYSPFEEDRFFARVVDGPDGHRYWINQEMRFDLNDGRTRNPRRWWWEHHHQTALHDYQDVIPTCGERRCINPSHCQTGRSHARRKYTDLQMIGALQVATMRLGRPPTEQEWIDSGHKPSSTTFGLRFGTWNKSLIAAGLEPNPNHKRPG